MAEDLPFKCPVVTDEDISRVTSLLGLPVEAFYGVDRKDPRQDVLKSSEQLDVAACPGSGKTTLLVAKLAILAEKWEYRTRGICVLSHTNVARNEIENKLGNSTVGRTLLGYPHFVGTIHSFVAEFLAIQWIRSLSYPVKLIDSEICESIRWKKLAKKWRSALEHRHVDKSDIRILDTNFRWAKKDGTIPLADDTETYREYQRACEQTAADGFHCYDDMFVWALDMMAKLPWIIGVIRDRFPILFIDETQDNSEEQSAILYKIFMEGDGPVIRQRFGDSNQAIFDYIDVQESETDIFPSAMIKKDIPNSYRFGQTIANLADPFGVMSYANGLTGEGPREKVLASGASEGQHTIFLSNEDSICKVMDAYGALILDTFSDQELEWGTFKAVGQVHKDKGNNHKPRHVGHYWSNYDPELARPDPKPGTFLGYVFVGMGRAKITGESYPFVEKIAEGILRFASMADGSTLDRRRRHLHRYVLDLLAESNKVRERYQDLISMFVVMREVLLKEKWNSEWREVVREIAATIAKAPLASQGNEDFLAWDEKQASQLFAHIIPKSRNNLYRYPAAEPKIAIRVGSIHSVKGETHTATLVLETFWHKHNLESIKDWLWRDDRRGGEGQGVSVKKRLKVHYVAMTRPTHLLCVAMKRSNFEGKGGVLDEQMVKRLEQRGWRVKEI
jgi:DNA helicase II / ATP-dependent DNA helicase PcrA